MSSARWDHYSAHNGPMQPDKSALRRARLAAVLRFVAVAAGIAAPIFVALWLSRGIVSDEEIRADPTRPGPSLPMHKAAR